MKRELVFTAVFVLMLTPPAYSQQPTQAKTSVKLIVCQGVHNITDCPPEGCGGTLDPELNKQKNNPSDGQDPVLRNIAWMQALPNPAHFTSKNRDRGEIKQIGEGQKITVVAWALAARKGGQETCNCKLKAKADTDNHIVLVDPSLNNPTLATNEKRDSETVEFTPRVRLQHPKFTQENLEPLIDPDWKPNDTPTKGKLLVRVTGILMFDSEHFLRNPLKRHNNWEIHPILKIEYCPEGQTCEAGTDQNWVDLEKH